MNTSQEPGASAATWKRLFTPVGATVTVCVALIGITTSVGLAMGASGGSVPDWIAALATVGALGAAVVAAVYALQQLRHAQAVQLDQSRPYVVVTMEQSPVDFTAIDVVVRNVGAGPAREVQLRCDPPLSRVHPRRGSGHNAPHLTDTRYFNEQIPLMPPGYELRLFFDKMDERCGGDHVPGDPQCPPGHADDVFTFTMRYTDGHGHVFSEDSVQDLGLLHELMFTDLRGTHHAAKALQSIAERLTKATILDRN